jgi:hypothetical protein
VTVEKNRVMAEITGYESFAHISCEKIINNALSVFGIPQRFIENVTSYVQHNGKIACENDDYRRALILHMTEKYNIYSFGRYAIWKQIRADRLLGDIEKIRKMISASEVGREYHLKLGEI